MSMPISYSQVLPSCQKQSDCSQGNYCDNVHFCSDCSYIDGSFCDSVNDCCSNDFLQQCPGNPHQCSIQPEKYSPITNTSYSDVHMFLLVFVVLSSSYLITGIYYNKYMKQKEGYNIIPNLNSWISLTGLVRDGFYYSTHMIKNKYNGEYTSME